MKADLYPIGTIVILKDSLEKVMITGFCSMSSQVEGSIYDYNGCSYPQGFLDSKEAILFNNNQIEKIIHKGYESVDDEKYKQKLAEIIVGMKKDILDNKENHKNNDDNPTLFNDLW